VGSMNFEEEIICKFCESKCIITYDDGEVYNKLLFCSFCGEELDEYIDEEENETDE